MDTVEHEVQEDPRMTDPFAEEFSTEKAVEAVKFGVQEDPRMTDPFAGLFSTEVTVEAVKHEVQEEPWMTHPFTEGLIMTIEAPDAGEAMAEQAINYVENCSGESSSYLSDEQIQVIYETVQTNEHNDVEIEINQIDDIVDMNDATVETYYFEINGEGNEVIVTSENNDDIAELDNTQEESGVLAVPMVVLEDLAPHLEQSKCFCKDCKILLATPYALDAHNTTAHSLLRSHKAVKSKSKSSVNVVRKSIVAPEKNSAQKGMSTTTLIKPNIAANPILKRSPKSPTVKKSPRKRKGEVESGNENRTVEMEKAMFKKNLNMAKTIVEALSPTGRKKLQQRKELSRTLLPDAPPRKKSRNLSPKREPCRLVPGTPSTPPPPKLQPWQIKKLERQKKQRAYETSPKSSLNSVAPSASSSVATMPKCDYTSGQLMTDMSPVAFVLGAESQPTQPAVSDSQPLPSAATGTLPDLQSPHQGKLNRKTAGVFDSQPTPSTAAVNPYRRKPKHKAARVSGEAVEHRTRQTEEVLLDSGDDDNLDIDIDECEAEGDIFGATGIDHLNNAPALLPDNLDKEVRQWLTNDDNECDRHLTHLLPLEYLTFDWKGDVSTFTGRRETFRGTPGPTFPLTKQTSPNDIFLKFFDDTLLDLIVTQTNEYATYVIDQKITSPHSRLNQWTNTNKGEIAVFIAIIIFQGLIQMPVETDYWRENGFLTLKYFQTLMKHSRYLLLKRMLHFSSISPESTTDSTDPKLRKISPVIKHLQEKFSSLYLPEQSISIDESLLKWSGHLSFAQKIATKAAKVGVKTYELCESKTGYLWNFFVYTGNTDRETGGQTDGHRDSQTDRHTNGQTARPTTSADHSRPPAPLGATAAIVLDLVKPLLNLGHTLVMDNFYNSPLLARYLKSHGTDCFGTLRVNRQYVPASLRNLSKAELRVGEVVYSYCRDVSICLYNDNSLVALLSTYHEGEAGGKEKNGKCKYRPKVVLDYNLSMGGVDKKDQLLAAHPMERTRNMVWYKKVFRRLVNVTVLNSYIIYKTQHPEVSQRIFRTRLANELVRMVRPPALITAPTRVRNSIEQLDVSGCKPGAIRPLLTGNHFVGKGDNKHKVCVWCHKCRSKYLCKQCQVTLCLEFCFEEYHTTPPGSVNKCK